MHVSRSDSETGSVVRADARGLRIGMAVSAYHGEITGAMREAATRCFVNSGGARHDLEVVEVPGAFELIAVCSALARHGDLDAIVAIGCIVTGETTHDQHIAGAVSTGIAHAIVETGVPIAFGVLTCQSIEQASERAGGAKGNKGEEAMHAAIAAARAVQRIQDASEVNV